MAGKVSARRVGRRRSWRVWVSWCVPTAAAVVAVSGSLASADDTCTTTWVGGGGNDSWQTAANWSTGSTPGAGDRACLPAGSNVYVSGGGVDVASVDSGGSLAISGGSVSLSDEEATSQVQSLDISDGSLSVAGTLDVSQLALSGGAVDGAGTVSVSDAFDWTRGSMTGSGVTELAAGGSGSIHPSTGSLVSMNARTLSNAGDLTLASGRLEVGQGGAVENSGTLTVHAQDVSGLPSWQQPGLYDAFAGARARLLNTGELLKTTGSGRTQVTLQVDNDGTVDAQSGEMLFGGGGYGGQTGVVVCVRRWFVAGLRR
jgi:hypothetical protein